MEVYVHCCSRMNVERFVMRVVDEKTLDMFVKLALMPSATFTPSGGKGTFRILEIEEYPGSVHIFALRAVPLH